MPDPAVGKLSLGVLLRSRHLQTAPCAAACEAARHPCPPQPAGASTCPGEHRAGEQRRCHDHLHSTLQRQAEKSKEEGGGKGKQQLNLGRGPRGSILHLPPLPPSFFCISYIAGVRSQKLTNLNPFPHQGAAAPPGSARLARGCLRCQTTPTGPAAVDTGPGRAGRGAEAMDVFMCHTRRCLPVPDASTRTLP